MRKAKTAKKTGRPTKFKPEFIKQVVKLCKLGAVDKDLADFFQVTVSTLCLWKAIPEFSAALKEGKAIADAEVASKLYHRATGYEHADIHVSNFQGDITLTPLTKHYAPDTTACIFWLKNRRPDLWRDRVENTVIPASDEARVQAAIERVMSQANCSEAIARTALAGYLPSVQELGKIG